MGYQTKGCAPTANARNRHHSTPNWLGQLTLRAHQWSPTLFRTQLPREESSDPGAAQVSQPSTAASSAKGGTFSTPGISPEQSRQSRAAHSRQSRSSSSSPEQLIPGRPGSPGSPGACPDGGVQSAGPDESRNFNKKLGQAGVKYLEAPVQGSHPEVAAGSLVIMVGSDEDPHLSPAWPVLEALGDNPRHMGKVGEAAAIKLAFNQLVASLMVG